MFKIIALGFALSLSLTVSQAAIADDTAPAAFDANKAEMLKNIDARIAKMNEHRTCVNATKDREGIKTCMEAMKDFHHEHKMENMEKRRDRMDKKMERMKKKE